jgi:hypothetical protein
MRRRRSSTAQSSSPVISLKTTVSHQSLDDMGDGGAGGGGAGAEGGAGGSAGRVGSERPGLSQAVADTAASNTKLQSKGFIRPSQA